MIDNSNGSLVNEQNIELEIKNTLKEIEDCVKEKMGLSCDGYYNVKTISRAIENYLKYNYKIVQIGSFDLNMRFTTKTIELTDDKEENKKLLTLYYAAIAYLNVNLLNKMLEEKVDFGKGLKNLNLYVLYWPISTKFQENEYIEIVKDCMGVFEDFYRTTINLPREEFEKYATRFAKILKARHKDLTPNGSLYEDLNLYRLFSKSRMDIYEDESYLKASKEQLNMMGAMALYNLKNEDTIRRLNNLIQTTDFSQYYCNADLMFSLFSDDELFRINYDTSYFFETISGNSDKLNKGMDFYNKVKDKIDGEIDIPFGFCCDEFMMVDNDVIVEISNKLGYIPSVTELMDMVTHVKSKSKVKRRKLK